MVLGPIADHDAAEIRGPLAWSGAPAAATLTPVVAGGTDASGLPVEIVGALGGDANVRTVHALHGRFRVELADAGRVDEGALARITHGIVRPRPDICHILL